ncbi:LCP family protein [Fuchsiella alkaliacetigena]|uniref:LCP family protein n=1 Tax=Fuchsiella alkaliacetigena TaxID=957042 RepID=UPI00200A0F53|nr:LCP family protein [Fuchsiella alkaliacetigena]MCK8825193.1 LCP family protein [Fuchsiella alkaliacetigena]
MASKNNSSQSNSRRYLKLGALVVVISILASFVVIRIFGDRFIEQAAVGEQLNFLVLGVDNSQAETGRTDVMLVVSVDPNSGEVGIISLPRDTRVEIPGRDSQHKLNAAYAYGGVELAVETVEKLLDFQLDHYVLTDFDGFINVVDALGGVEVEVAEDLKYIDQAGGLYIDIPAGEQVLTGKESLEYIRYREGSLGDIGRIARQQKFLDAFLTSALQPRTILQVPELIKQLKDNLETDIAITQAIKLAGNMRNLSREQVAMETLPGKADYVNGISYWLNDEKQTQILVDNLIKSKDYLSNSQIKVTILNGNGHFGIAKEKAEFLGRAGYDIAEVSNADSFDYIKTEIYFRSAAEERAESLAEYLNNQQEIAWNRLSDGLIRKSEADIKIILGKNLI